MKKLWILLLIPFLIGAAPTRLNNFVSSTTIRSDDVNEEFNNLYGHLAKGITNSTGYWLCTNSTCSTTCQVTIDGGIITDCN